MTDGNSDLRRYNWLANLFIWAMLLAFIAIPASIGVAVARAYPSREYPALGTFVSHGLGLLILAQGLIGQFRLAAFGPKNPSQNRVQASVLNTGLVLIGISQLLNNNWIGLPLASLGLVLSLAGAFRRPRKLF